MKLIRYRKMTMTHTSEDLVIEEQLTNLTIKHREHQEIQQQIDEFIARGGNITELPPEMNNDQNYQFNQNDLPLSPQKYQ